MTKVSVNILTKNRSQLLKLALDSVNAQSFKDFQVWIVDDASDDQHKKALEEFVSRSGPNLRMISHTEQMGITYSRQQALMMSEGDYVAILDDDDEWTDVDKLKKQVEFLDNHPDVVLVGGGINIVTGDKLQVTKFRPTEDEQIRKTMLFRNNFFTSTVMFRRFAAIKVGGFVNDGVDLAEDYDLWLRMGKLGKMANFNEVFAKYRQPNYNKEKKSAFLGKQLGLINKQKKDYPYAFFANILMKFRLFL